MALFRLKKDTEEKKTSKDVAVSDTNKEEKVIKKEEVKKTTKKVASDVLSLNYKKDVPSVLKHPRVTEKATILSESGVYVFDVAPRATKKDVAEAVEALYKVTPRKINMVKVPSKRVRMRRQQNKYGVKSGGKKAYVFVKKGDTIDIV
jgi:large subunit ribosomal protein L23